MDPSLTLLAQYTCASTYSGFDDATLRECRRRIVDAFGCVLAAHDEEPVRIARTAGLRASVANGAHLAGTGHRTLPELAGFANGVAVRCLEGNDCFPGGGGHPSDAIMAILAVAQTCGADAQTAMAAIVVAYEIHYQLYRKLLLRDKGLDHPFYTGVATAAASAKVMGLSLEQTANAISLTVTSNLSLEVARRGELSMWKGGAGPNAARNGAFCAILARGGMTGPTAPFDAVHGLWDLIGRHDLGPLPAGPTPALMLAHYKYYLTEYHSQAAIMAAMDLRSRLDVRRIASVEIETYRFAWSEIGSGREKWRPASREAADHSLPYIVAAVLVDGAFSEAIFLPERFTDPRILDLIDKVTVSENAEFSASFPGAVPCRMTITTIDGERHVLDVRNPCGHPQNPMTDEQISEKFRALASRVLRPAQVGNALGLLWQFGEGPTLDDIFQSIVIER
jgi:2-methylcitrate dehydratase